MCIDNLLGICFFSDMIGSAVYQCALQFCLLCEIYQLWHPLVNLRMILQIHPNPSKSPFPTCLDGFCTGFSIYDMTMTSTKIARQIAPTRPHRHPIGIRSPSLSVSAWPSPARPVLPRARQLWWSPAPRHATSYHRCWRSSSTATGLKGDFVELRTEETWKDMIV